MKELALRAKIALAIAERNYRAIWRHKVKRILQEAAARREIVECKT
jgi:hypothetical protein